MTPAIKAKQLLITFNNDTAAAVRVCEAMISTCLLTAGVEFYKQVKQILCSSK